MSHIYTIKKIDVFMKLTLCWNDLDFDLFLGVGRHVEGFVLLLQRWSVKWAAEGNLEREE